jgi:hypothetical protein
MRRARGRRRTVGTLIRAGVCAGTAIVLAVPMLSAPGASADTDRLRVDFDSLDPGDRLGQSASVLDSSGEGNHGVVRTAYGGSVAIVADATGTVADFPNRCWSEPCPNALIRVADDASLDPGTSAFEWGARVLLKANETADGENVVQKGTWGEPGGQWKLQVDKAAGIPSCVVSGAVPGTNAVRRTVLRASISVADGRWHSLVCRRTTDGLKIVIDGAVRGSAPMPAVRLESAAPVTIGAKSASPADNDQFHGMLDDVFMTVL